MCEWVARPSSDCRHAAVKKTTVTCARRRVASAARYDQVEGLLVVIIQVELLYCLLKSRHLILNRLTKLGSSTQTRGEDLRAELEIFHVDPVHLVHLHVIPRRIQVIGIVGLPEKSGGAPLSYHIAFLQRSRQHDKRKHRFIRWLDPDDV